MSSRLLSILLPLTLALGAQAQNPERVVVLGDSITYSGAWVATLDAWMLSKGQKVEIINLGLGSETATDLTDTEQLETHIKPHGFPRPTISERLDRILTRTNPDWVIVCYGMNDGSSLPQNKAGFLRFQEGMQTLKSKIEKSGTKRVTFLTPPIHDAGPGKPRSKHDEMLALFSAWMLSQRNKGWEVVDVHGPMSTALAENRTTDPKFRFARDGVHPGGEGHDLMARQLISHLSSTEEAGTFFASSPYLKEPLRSLIQQRMKIRGSAWLTSIGHQRPKVAKGLPLNEAAMKITELDQQIEAATAQATTK